MTRAAIPDPPDEACRDRETVRLPRSTSHEIQDLVDEGKYPNRSAVIRAGARLLIKCEREDVWPAFRRGRGSTADESEEPADTEEAGSLQEIADGAEDVEEAADEVAEAAAESVEAAAESVEAAAEESPDAEADATGAAEQVADAAADGDGYEFVTESDAVSESDIVTKLSAVMREATAGERESATSA